jgi:hypothetical protein
MSGVLRRGASFITLAILVLLALGYRFLPELSPPATASRELHVPVPEFHRFDRAQVEGLDVPDSPCLACHPPAAHHLSGERRAFLNLHRRTLDCGVCHLSGRGVSARHFREAEVVTAASLASGPYGRVYAAVRIGGKWQRVETPGGPATLRAHGPDCGTCHRRGSPFLAADGLLDPYRRRVLEDLSVLRFLGDSR